MPEDPTPENTAKNPTTKPDAPKKDGAEARKADFSQTAKAPQTRPVYKTAERGVSSGSDSRSRGRSSVWFVALLLIIVLVAIGNAYYSHFLIEGEREARQASSEKLDAQVESHINSLGEQLAGGKEPLRQGVADLEKEVSDHSAALKLIQQEMSALESSFRILRTETEKGPQPGNWDIAEVAYLMRIANQRLQLEQDVGTALVALQIADQILEKVADPALTPVRSELAEEINALKAVPAPDISGMTLSLASLIEQVKALELKKSALDESAAAAETETEVKATEQAPEEAPATTIAKAKEFLHVIWDDFKQLVTIRQRGEGESGAPGPVLSPKERYFLYQNLRLELESARLSLLQKSQESFQQSLQLAHQWLETYFQGSKAAAMMDSLAKLAHTPISPELPDISGSLKALDRVLGHARAQAAGDNEGGKA